MENSLDIRVIDTKKSGIPLRKCMKNGILPKFPFSMVIVGSSGSGKSNLLMNLLTREEFYGNYFHYTIVFSPTAGELDDVYDVLKLPQENFIKDFKKSSFDDLLTSRKDLIKKKGINWVAKNSRVLILLDDCISERSFLNSPEALKLFILLRHYLCSVIMLSQSYTKIPRALRLNSMGSYIFPSTRSEVEIILDELCPPHLTKKDFLKVISYCTEGQYDFLAYNRHAAPGERLRKNLKEVIDLDKFKTNKSTYYEKNKYTNINNNESVDKSIDKNTDISV